MKNEIEEQMWVKKPLSDKDMDTKLDEIRQNVSQKMDKWANRITISMSTRPRIERVEGEVWEEDGKKWTIKDGIRQNLTVLDDARMPWWCPKCSKPMNHRFDRKFYYRKGICYNCVIDWEGELRNKRDGTFERYERRILRANERSFLKDEIDKKIDFMRTFKEPQIHFQDGRWEKLATIDDFKDLFETLEKDIEFMLARLEYMDKEDADEAANFESAQSPEGEWSSDSASGVEN